MFYSLVNAQGDLVKSMFTTDPNFSAPGFRVLPDNPPSLISYVPGSTKLIRVLPVPPEATEIQYKLIVEAESLKPNEVSI